VIAIITCGVPFSGSDINVQNRAPASRGHQCPTRERERAQVPRLPEQGRHPGSVSSLPEDMEAMRASIVTLASRLAERQFGKSGILERVRHHE